MAEKIDFTERESKLMALAWQCFSEQPKVDFDKLARLGGYTNVRSASNAWGQIKKKLAAQAADTEANDDDGSGTPKTTPKATPNKRGRKAADEDDSGETPAKKTKGCKGGKASKGDSGEDNDELVKSELDNEF